MKPLIAGIVLAAGSGGRMGEVKQLLDYGGKPVLQWVIDAACDSMLDSVFVVLGYEKERIIKDIDFSKAGIIENSLFEHGQSTSLKAGVQAISQEYEAAMFLLGDQPLVDSNVINKIRETYLESRASILIPTFKGKRGNPVLMDRSVFPRLMKLSGDTGGRALFQEYNDSLKFIEVDCSGILFDLDTKEDYQELLQKRDPEDTDVMLDS
ncbi:molybdenum cofactor cytidylyltransferase [bacterium]|nr:molybdenum cofactor cytidylyltransferase [bacterium]